MFGCLIGIKQQKDYFMIRFILPIAFLITLSMTFYSCKKVIGTGPSVSEIRSMSNFDGISLAMEATVHITQDSLSKVEIIAQQNILDEISTKISGSTLIIMYKPNIQVKGNDVIINISVPKMGVLNVSGSGSIQMQNQLATHDLNLNVSGSGRIHIPSIEADDIRTTISGSGEIDISSGVATSLRSTISGSGNLDALNMQSAQVTTSTSGSGTTRVYATQSLFAEISGSGNVYYRGNPVVESEISGSGKLIKQ